MTSPDLTRTLADIGVGDRPVTGGKAAGLGELASAGITVPPGFVVTTRAFALVLRALDPEGALRAGLARLPAGDNAEVARSTARVRRLIAAAPLPGGLHDAITAQYRGLGGGPVAVRSSGTGEDSAEASFAGMADSYLWVRGTDSVVDHVRSCWASLYNAEAVSYRRRMRIDERDLGMAVIVQRMVDPRSSGVMFTCSPVTGDRSVIAVEAAWGLGSALVAGDVTPDSYVVSKVTGEIVRRTVAVKLRRHQMDPSGHGVSCEDVPEPLREQPCVSDGEVAALARLGRQLEQHYGAPQDVEWAITADAAPGGGRIVVLQCRAETVWAGRAAEPAALPKARAVDHVFAGLSQVARIDTGTVQPGPPGTGPAGTGTGTP